MTTTLISAERNISLTRGVPGADGSLMGALARSEPAGRVVPSGESRRLVAHEVVVAARNGSSTSLGQLCTAIHPRLIGFFRYSGLSMAEAEDLAGDVVEDVITGLSSLRNTDAFEAWMWSIGRNRLKGWIRTTRRPQRVSPPTPQSAGPEELALVADDHSRIREALSIISKRDRELLWLREVEGLSYAEIGGRLGSAAGTVRVACHRARRSLEEAYQEERN